MKDNYIIAIVGKTSSGKDTAAKYLHDKYGLDMVVSHTTRPMRTHMKQMEKNIGLILKKNLIIL